MPGESPSTAAQAPPVFRRRAAGKQLTARQATCAPLDPTGSSRVAAPAPLAPANRIAGPPGRHRREVRADRPGTDSALCSGEPPRAALARSARISANGTRLPNTHPNARPAAMSAVGANADHAPAATEPVASSCTTTVQPASRARQSKLTRTNSSTMLARRSALSSMALLSLQGFRSPQRAVQRAHDDVTQGCLAEDAREAADSTRLTEIRGRLESHDEADQMSGEI